MTLREILVFTLLLCGSSGMAVADISLDPALAQGGCVAVSGIAGGSTFDGQVCYDAGTGAMSATGLVNAKTDDPRGLALGGVVTLDSKTIGKATYLIWRLDSLQLAVLVDGDSHVVDLRQSGDGFESYSLLEVVAGAVEHATVVTARFQPTSSGGHGASFPVVTGLVDVVGPLLHEAPNGSFDGTLTLDTVTFPPRLVLVGKYVADMDNPAPAITDIRAEGQVEADSSVSDLRFLLCYGDGSCMDEFATFPAGLRLRGASLDDAATRFVRFMLIHTCYPCPPGVDCRVPRPYP